MSVWRVGLAIVTAIAGLVGLANFAVWHAPVFLPLAFYAALLCALALFERGRYRSAPFAPGVHGTPTGESFFDPSTGAPIRVYYDATTGARDYRPDDGRKAGR
jgi:hypothetical protein